MPNETVQLHRQVRINAKAASALVAFALAAGVGYFLVNSYQSRRMRQEALAAVGRLEKAGETDLALRHLNHFMASQPPDTELLTLKARLTDREPLLGDRILEVAKVYDQIVRLGPEGPDSQKARRRLVELYIKFSDALRASELAGWPVELVLMDSRRHAAEAHARQLIAHGASEPWAHRLLASTLDDLAGPSDVKGLNDAIREYRVALQGDPTDSEAASRLSELYLRKMKDPTRAERVLDDLMKARPGSVETHLMRDRFFVKLRLDEKAKFELDAAVKLKPDDPEVILASAEEALRGGDIIGARARLAKIPEAHRNDVRVLLVGGMIDYADERPDEAVGAWRKGLMSSAGTDAEMTWWLAYAMLQMGRITDAEPLVLQYGRIAGAQTPMYGFLLAIYNERTGRPAIAIRRLEQVAPVLSDRLREIAYLSLGRCHEALFDNMKASDAYHRAIQTDLTSVLPRLELAKLKMKSRPDEAIEILQRGLAVLPSDPALRIALAGAMLNVQAARPDGRRNWSDFDEAYRKAAASSPDSSAVLLMMVDRLNLSGREADAFRTLEGAAAKTPRSVSIAVALAEALNRKGQGVKALEVLDRARGKDAAGDHPALRIAQSRVLTSIYRGREAREALSRDVDTLTVSQRVDLTVALGQMEIARGNLVGAREAYEGWARLVPQDPRPKLALLEIALRQNNVAAVRAVVEELRGSGGGEEIAYRLARAKELLHERDALDPVPGTRDASLDEAAEHVKRVLEEAPELPAAQFLWAGILERRNRIDEAIAAYERAWERGTEAALPRIVDLLASRKRYDALAKLRTAAPGSATQVDLLSAQSFVRAGDVAQAARIAEMVARDLPDSPNVLGWQARMLTLLGRFEDAESALRAMADRQPGSLEPWLALLRYQAEHKRTQAVAETLREIKAKVKTDRPDLIDARSAWAADDREAADKAFEKALTLADDDETLFLAAKYYEETGRPETAETLLNRVLKRSPDNRPAARQLASVLSARTGDPAAWESARKLVEPVGPAPEDRLAYAIVYSRSGNQANRDKAIEALDNLRADLPADHAVAVTARDYLARLLIEAGQVERANQIAAISASKGTDPNAIALYARTLIQSKKPEAAEWQLDRLTALNPGDQREAGLRAKAIYDRSRPVEAAAALERAYTLREDAPNSESLGREVFSLLNEMGPNASVVAERVGRKIARKQPGASWMPASVLARRGKADEAFDLLLMAVRPGTNREDLREAAKVASKIAESSPDTETLRKAGAVIDAALKVEPESDEVLVMSAMLHHLQADYDEEVRLYRKVQDHRPDNPVVLNNLAWALCEGKSQPVEALKLAEDLVKSVGHDPEALDTRGVVFTRLTRFDDAIRDLEEVVQKAPTGLHHFHLARAYRLAGRLEDAKKSRDQARSAGLTPEGVDAPERVDLKALLEM